MRFWLVSTLVFAAGATAGAAPWMLVLLPLLVRQLRRDIAGVLGRGRPPGLRAALLAGVVERVS